MLVNSVVIVLREVLEAAVIISILLHASRTMRMGWRWLVAALAGGVVGAGVYATYLAGISDLFDGVGQELVNATVQLGVFAALLVSVFLMARFWSRGSSDSVVMPVAMGLAVALAATQEGSEILVYVSGFLGIGDLGASVITGSLAGAGIGFSVGVLFYYLLLALPLKRAFWVSLVLLSLEAASMCIQATRLLIQADKLPASAPLWDSSGVISEGSLPGQLLYALAGYEATPGAVEVSAYGVSLLAILVAGWIGWRSYPTRPGKQK